MLPSLLLVAWTLAVEAASSAGMTAEQAGAAARDDLSRLPELAGRTIAVLSVAPNPGGTCPGPKRVDAPLPGYVASLRAGQRTYLVLVGERETRVCFYMEDTQQPTMVGRVPMPPPPAAGKPKSQSPAPAKPAPAPPASTAPRPEAEAARQALAERLRQSPAEIEIVSVEEVTWPDTSLGCPRPGMAYTQVLVEGYRVILESGGKRFEYHGRSGGPPTWCSTPQPLPEDLR